MVLSEADLIPQLSPYASFVCLYYPPIEASDTDSSWIVWRNQLKFIRLNTMHN